MLKLNRSSPHPKPTASKSRRPAASRIARAALLIRRWLGVRPLHVPGSSAVGKGSRFDAAELKLVRHDLAMVLDQHPEARTVMRFVRALEHGLHKHGRHALDRLPVELLRRAMGQLDAVVVDWSPVGLSTLRSKAALSIAERDRIADKRQGVSTLASYSEVEVEEASVTTFMAANEEWERSFTGTTAATSPDALADTRPADAPVKQAA